MSTANVIGAGVTGAPVINVNYNCLSGSTALFLRGIRRAGQWWCGIRMLSRQHFAKRATLLL
jgi:hypothetical protein